MDLVLQNSLFFSVLFDGVFGIAVIRIGILRIADFQLIQDDSDNGGPRVGGFCPTKADSVSDGRAIREELLHEGVVDDGDWQRRGARYIMTVFEAILGPAVRNFLATVRQA